VNTALLLRTIKHGEEGKCPLTTHPLKIQDMAGLAGLLLPIIALVGIVSFWFLEHNISYNSIFFPTPYQSR